MICVVKDKNTGELFPSCGIPAQEGMDVITRDEDIVNARKDTLELLLSDHVGECEARCRIACPAFMDIPRMNRLIAEGKPLGGAGRRPANLCERTPRTPISQRWQQRHLCSAGGMGALHGSA